MAPSVPLASALQQRLQLRAVESDHGLSVDHRDRRGKESLVLELAEGLLVGADVLLGEGDAALVKELLHLAAEQSARLRIDHDRLRHRSSAFMRLYRVILQDIPSAEAARDP